MPEIANLGKILIVIGIAVVLTGIALMVAGRWPVVGRLPGDILIRRDGVVFYFPLLSCLILSIILTIIANVIARVMR